MLIGQRLREAITKIQLVRFWMNRILLKLTEERKRTRIRHREKCKYETDSFLECFASNLVASTQKDGWSRLEISLAKILYSLGTSDVIGVEFEHGPSNYEIERCIERSKKCRADLCETNFA